MAARLSYSRNRTNRWLNRVFSNRWESNDRRAQQPTDCTKLGTDLVLNPALGMPYSASESVHTLIFRMRSAVAIAMERASVAVFKNCSELELPEKQLTSKGKTEIYFWSGYLTAYTAWAMSALGETERPLVACRLRSLAFSEKRYSSHLPIFKFFWHFVIVWCTLAHSQRSPESLSAVLQTAPASCSRRVHSDLSGLDKSFSSRSRDAF